MSWESDILELRDQLSDSVKTLTSKITTHPALRKSGDAVMVGLAIETVVWQIQQRLSNIVIDNTRTGTAPPTRGMVE